MSATNSTLTAERLRELLHYEPETGVFTWRVARSNVKAGTTAGTPMVNNYLCIRADKKLHLAHRLAWLYQYGVAPPSLVDHIDGDKANNRISNLRLGTKVTNGQNRHAAQINNKSSGLLGVAWIEHTRKYIGYSLFMRQPCCANACPSFILVPSARLEQPSNRRTHRCFDANL